MTFAEMLGTFQHNRFLVAEMKIEVDAARVYVDRCIEAGATQHLYKTAAGLGVAGFEDRTHERLPRLRPSGRGRSHSELAGETFDAVQRGPAHDLRMDVVGGCPRISQIPWSGYGHDKQSRFPTLTIQRLVSRSTG